ncbi:MAG TPA: hypothetical protein VFP90_15970 [Gemmatimonadaceae bacterium]|nr:hypothetical protein [Gemmatimonadaceae bacterium]
MRGTALILAGLTLLAACGDQATTREPAGPRPSVAAEARGASAAENEALATLRATIAPLHRFALAGPAGWDNQFPAGCMFNADSGGMGLHYLNGKNMGVLDPARPQLVIYEPEKNGQMRLVGVEFILPGDPSDTPPVLFDQPFTYNYTFSVWALHVWAAENNPSGLYANWNPRVSCQYATTLAAQAH